MDRAPTCERCGEAPTRLVSFRYGHVRAIRYRIGDRVRFEGDAHDIGDQDLACVEAYGWDLGCENCGLGSTRVYSVRIAGNVIQSVRPADHDQDWYLSDFRVCGRDGSSDPSR